jgi:hypothetical protein
MPAIVKDGVRVTGSKAALQSGAGRLLGYLISHKQADPQTVTFYDSLTASGSILHVVIVPLASCPYYVRFGHAGRDEGIQFSTGLSVVAGSCEVAVWSVGAS